MKRIFYIFFLLHCTIIIVHSQWQPEVLIGSVDGFGYPIVSSYGNSINVFWHDYRQENWEIYQKFSTDRGLNWSPDVRLTYDTLLSRDPSAVISGSNVHLTWTDQRDGKAEIYYKRSTDGGIHWGSDTRITNNSANSISSSLTESNSILHLIWTDNRDGNNEIYYKRSSDAGLNWGVDTRLTFDTSSSLSSTGSISSFGDMIHLVWRDNRIGYYQLYYKRSTDGGVNWTTDEQIVIVPAVIGSFVKLQASGPVVHVLWNDNRSGHNELYYKRSTNSGTTWLSTISLTNNLNQSFNPYISVSGEIVHIVCQRLLEETAQIVYIQSFDGGAVWEPELELASPNEVVFFPSITSSDSNVYLFFLKSESEESSMYFRRNPTGNVIGISNISTEIPADYSLYQNFPNPFNPITKIKFEIKENAPTTLKIYDLLGRENETLVNGQLKPGTYEVQWDGSNYPSGIYFYKIQTEKFNEVKKMILLK